MRDLQITDETPSFTQTDKKEDTPVLVYMCGIDWQHELSGNPSGTMAYPSEEALKRKHACTHECGIVELEVKLRRWTAPQDFSRLFADADDLHDDGLIHGHDWARSDNNPASMLAFEI